MKKPYAHIKCPHCNEPHYDLNEIINVTGKLGRSNLFKYPHRMHQCASCRRTFRTDEQCVGIPEVSFIVAVAKNQNSLGKEFSVIGNKGGMPWERIPGDMGHFAKKTLGHTIVVGNSTFLKTPGFPLRDRQHYVLSKAPIFPQPRATYTNDPLHVFSSKPVDGKIIIIGGASVYPLYSDLYSEAWVTYIDYETTGDVKLDVSTLLRKSGLIKTEEQRSITDCPYPYTIVHYQLSGATT